jgi:putative oxidoreductase
MADTAPVGLAGFRRFLLEWSDVPLRVPLAATFIAHGYQKIFVMGVGNFAPMLEQLGVPAPSIMAWVVALAEFAGGVAIALGLFTRLAALGHACVMAVAIASVHHSQGFMAGATMGPRGPQATGYEWQLALLCIALCLVIRGAGPLSIDAIIRWRRRRNASAAPQTP